MNANFRPDDFITRAFAREREATQVPRLPMEYESSYRHVFRCVCCRRKRQNEDRQHPGSEVCVYCVQEAGVLN